MIEIYSFEEWDALQDPDKMMGWGSAFNKESSELVYTSALYKDCPLEIRKMFYAEYVHRSTNPIVKP